MEDVVKRIIEAGVQAPSGGNSQPWKFKVENNKIYVFALPEKDHPILNFHYRGTWIAHGALIENMLIASSALGYESRISLFPELSQPNLTAIITLDKKTPRDELLYQYIPLRATNRKHYRITPLTNEQKSELLVCASKIENVKVKLAETEKEIKTLGQAVSVNEIIMLEDRELHKLFFKEIVWTEKEEKEKKSGLYLKTMELKPPQQFALKIFKYWPIMNFLNRFGFAEFIARDNANIYSTAAAFGVIIVNKTDNDAFINAGRAMERIWLTATKMGLGFHLITGVLFLHQRIEIETEENFSRRHSKLITDAYEKIAGIFDVKDGMIVLLFRIGYGELPTARSSKKSPEIIYQNI